MDVNCSLYLRPDPNPPNPEELKRQLSTGNLEEKAGCLKTLIRCIINDESYPRLIMHIITTVIPVIHESNELRKVMLLYWEVIEKNKSATDDTLKDELLLACNSLKKDLLHTNEYLRARTLRLVSRMMHQGIVHPLANDIVENLTHKSSYVRRNAVVCLYQVFLHFGLDVIGDIDEEVEKLLLSETDLSTKRNAFLLLYQSNEQKAMKYIQDQMANQNLEEMGDILQLAVLEIFRKKCKEDPTQRPKLLKMIIDFSKKANESVMLECAIALTAISTSSSTLKNSLNAYVSILSTTTELNVTKVILDKLQLISGNSKHLEDIVQDLITVLKSPSYEIKEKVLQIIRQGLSLKNAQKVLSEIEREFAECKNDEYQVQLIRTVQYLSDTFPETHGKVIATLLEMVFPSKALTPLSCQIIKDTLISLMENSDEPTTNSLMVSIIDSFPTIEAAGLYKGVLYLFGTYLKQPELLCKALDRIKFSIGSLPITKAVVQQHRQASPTTAAKKIVKTIILPDGTYGTKIITEQELHKEAQQKQPALRNLLLDDSILGGILVRNVSRMFYKLRGDTGLYNRYGCSILMVFCSLLRYYQQNIHAVDQATIDQLVYVIRLITNPSAFQKFGEVLGVEVGGAGQSKDKEAQGQLPTTIEKSPDDTIIFRQLKPKTNSYELDFEDEELTQNVAATTNSSTELISRLRTLVQLTGYFDPIYAETFVTVRNYDVFFDILLINNSSINLLNVQVEFFSNSEILVLEKAAVVNLKPGQSTTGRCHIKFAKSEFGSIFGSINYDNHAGIEQAYLVTQEIRIDFLQFIEPVQISMSEFRRLWKVREHEQTLNRETTNTYMSGQLRNVADVIRQHQKFLHSKAIDFVEAPQDHFVNVHIYGRSKLGEDFLVTLVVVRGERLSLSYSIKAKEREMAEMIAGKLSQEFRIEDEQEQE